MVYILQKIHRRPDGNSISFFIDIQRYGYFIFNLCNANPSTPQTGNIK